MSELRHDKQNGTGEEATQNQAHLENMSEEELIARMVDVVDNMDMMTFDPADLDIYLDALEKIAPLNLNYDVAAKKAEFWEQHADLIAKAFPRDKKPEGVPVAPTKVHPARPKIFNFKKILATACAIALVLCGAGLSLHASGTDVYGSFIKWTNETFGLTSRDTEVNRPTESNPCLELKVALNKYSPPDNSVPSYLPEGFAQKGIILVSENLESTFVGGRYENGDELIAINYNIKPESDNNQLQSDDLSPDVYQAGGFNHYISTNMGKWVATWDRGNFECNITGVPSRAELELIIDSMYEE